MNDQHNQLSISVAIYRIFTSVGSGSQAEKNLRKTAEGPVCQFSRVDLSHATAERAERMGVRGGAAEPLGVLGAGIANGRYEDADQPEVAGVCGLAIADAADAGPFLS